MKDKTVLLVDDEEKVLFLLSDALEEKGYRVKSTTHPSQALKILEEEPVDAVVLDLVMPGSDGIEVLQAIRKIHPNLPVVMLSGHGTIKRAVETVKLGAYDFLEKPVASDKIALTLENALRQAQREQDHHPIHREANKETQLIGESPAFRQLLLDIEKMAPTDLPVLITGESGTGKELIARALHFHSNRSRRPFVPVNCAAIPENLMESEIFGHEKGAFTDAHQEKPGLMETAHSGTLFLDEISEMHIKIQPKFLRALERKEIQRVGGTTLKSVDVRIIAAANKNLEQAITEETFREDLYYRIAVLTLHAPPLRERKEDIPLLVTYFAARFCRERDMTAVAFHPQAMELLMKHPWPGNVRQLKNLVEKIVVLSETNPIKPCEISKHLAPGMKNGKNMKKEEIETNSGNTVETLEEARNKAERDKLLNSLEAFDWNYEQAAGALDISRATLFNKLKLHGISRKNRNGKEPV